MARRSHFANAPSPDRGDPLTPEALTKQEFGRRLQQLLDERHWNQSDLARRINEQNPDLEPPFGRDAISTYIKGRSFPTPKSLSLLCKAFGMTREELFPNSAINAINDEHPAVELKVAPGQAGKAWLRVNRLMTFGTAAQIVQIINEEDQREASN